METIRTRFAPSPTGFVHMGSLLSAYEDYKAAKDTEGIFYLRIEDTDQKRSVENGISGILNDLKNFDIDKCNERFENFYRLHNLEVDRLTGKKNLSSIAI